MTDGTVARVGKATIEITQGDITRIAADAIVNAANGARTNRDRTDRLRAAAGHN